MWDLIYAEVVLKLFWGKLCQGCDPGEAPRWREPGKGPVSEKGLVTHLEDALKFGNVLTVWACPLNGSKRDIPHAHVPENGCNNAGCCKDQPLETVDNRSEVMSSAHLGFLKRVLSFIYIVARYTYGNVSVPRTAP